MQRGNGRSDDGWVPCLWLSHYWDDVDVRLEIVNLNIEK